MIAYVAARGFAASDTSPTQAVLSFLFIPYPRPSGEMSPVYGVGWTLNYEMFFYAVFALCLAARREITVARVADRAGRAGDRRLVAAGIAGGARLLGRPDRARIRARHAAGARLPKRRPAADLGGGAVIDRRAGADPVCTHQTGTTLLPRWLGFGLPAAMMVAVTHFGGAGYRDRLDRPDGRASYALYLCHPVVIAVGRMLSLDGYLDPAAMPWVYLCGVVAASIGAALLLHRVVEVPCHRGCPAIARGRWRPRERGLARRFP